jgi:hypothetical protein
MTEILKSFGPFVLLTTTFLSAIFIIMKYSNSKYVYQSERVVQINTRIVTRGR